MPWATHVLQWQIQRVTILRSGVNLKSLSQYGLKAAIRFHEDGIASNRRSAMLR